MYVYQFVAIIHHRISNSGEENSFFIIDRNPSLCFDSIACSSKSCGKYAPFVFAICSIVKRASPIRPLANNHLGDSGRILGLYEENVSHLHKHLFIENCKYNNRLKC